VAYALHDLTKLIKKYFNRLGGIIFHNMQIVSLPIRIIKNKLLFLLFALVFSPIISTATATVTTTLEIEFAFTLPEAPEQQLLGYRLYRDGVKVCATNDPNVSKITCDIPTEDGTFDFTLAAYYTDGAESPQSPSFPFTIGSAPVTLPPAPTPDQQPPTALLSSSTAAGNGPVLVTFDGTSSTTPNPPIVKYSWTFGDGSQATGEKATHSFTTAGTYYTKLTVEDSKGLTDSVDTPIIVIESIEPNVKPNAAISPNVPGGDAPITFSFDGSKSSEPDGTVASYNWNFFGGIDQDCNGSDCLRLLNQTQVSQLYVSIFGRASEGEGNQYWQSDQSDMTVAANTMLNTEPAKAYFGDTLNDNQMFIEFIYKNTLGKDYADDPEGVNYWVSELTGGKSKGEVVATLINAAIDPQYAGLAAQDQFLNKVAVSNYTAEAIITVPNVNDLSAFVNFISDVTNDPATVVAAKAAVDSF